jgi:hypothetical protein
MVRPDIKTAKQARVTLFGLEIERSTMGIKYIFRKIVDDPISIPLNQVEIEYSHVPISLTKQRTQQFYGVNKNYLACVNLVMKSTVRFAVFSVTRGCNGRFTTSLAAFSASGHIPIL